tara:strand:- start:178 stop:546 length:369 start_codon:yes stop_codon:yes gene_type:complete
MSKITEQDRSLMIKHLREISKLSTKANIKHHSVIEKNLTHTIQLTKFMQEDRAKIERLNTVVDIKQREIDELNKQNTDLLWDLSKLQLAMGKLQKEKEINDKKKAQYEKISTQFYTNESVDN